MTDKQKLIIDFLTETGGQGFYIDIRDKLGIEFANEIDFDSTLKTLMELKLIHERDNDTFYKLNFPKYRVEYSIRHVTLFYADNGDPLLRIEDTELFDAISDILTEEHDITDHSHASETIGNVETYTLFFPDNIDKEKLNKVIRSIDQADVEKIFRLNN